MKIDFIKKKRYYLALALLTVLFLIWYIFLMPSKSYIAKKSLELKFEQEVIAFTDVNVVPMDSERVLKAQTVIVRCGVIESIDAGLTPYQAIKMGTRNAAEFLGKLDEFGTVSVGKRADLVLLGGNPLHDISHFQEIFGVMIHGRWLQREELDMMLGEFAESYKKQDWKTRLKITIISFFMSF